MKIKTKSMLPKHAIHLSCGLIFLGLAACGGKQPQPVDPEPATGLRVGGINAQFTLPEADSSVNLTKISLPLARPQTESQALLGSPSGRYMPLYDFWKYADVLPHPELYCDEPTNSEFVALAGKLGGFRKTTSVYIEPDATAPRVQSGWMFDSYLLRSAAPESAAAGGSGGVTIQRPNIVGRSGSRAFYQSDVYGLITVDFANVPFETPKVSCAQPLPGRPKNFVVTDTNLYAIVEDTAGLSSGVIQFDITGEAPQYVKGVVLKDQAVEDARLFNDTLVMYLRTYAPGDQQAQNPEPLPVASDVGGAARISIAPPYYSRQYVYHELAVFDTLPQLALTHRESFIPEGSENPAAAEAPAKPEDLYRYRSFNNFLSASGEYLLVTEQVRERHFTGYKTQSYYRCSDYKVTEVPYSYCQTQWKRVENPDYSPPPASGVFSCSGNLADCLKNDGPRVSRYIYVPDGEQCHSGTRNNYSCIAGATVSYDVPQYRWESKTQVYAFRFEGGQFVRLDNQLATVNNANQIEVASRPFLLNGRVQKHDHMQFHGDNLYIISNDESNDQVNLHTLTIAGNSPVYVNQLTLGGSKNYSTLSAAFTDNTIYLSDGSYNRASSSNLITLSLANPLAPRSAGTVTIPTQLDQLFFTGDNLLGVGRISQRSASLNRTINWGSVTRFSPGGVEQNSLVLGADYSYYYHQVASDDQIISVDQWVNRLFLPYQVSQPLPGNTGPSTEYRLTAANFSDGNLVEEGTVNVPQMIERTLSVDQDTAFAFSQEFIHQLTFSDGVMKSAILMDGELPESIYYARNSATQIQKRVHPNSYNFQLIDSPKAASGNILDQVTVPRKTSQICFGEQVLFDRDRVVVVSEKAGAYIDYNDCPKDYRETEKIFTGYRIQGGKLVAITDKAEMEMVWLQSFWHTICVVDTNETGGKVLTDFDLEAVSSLQCYTQEQFWKALQEKMNPGSVN